MDQELDFKSWRCRVKESRYPDGHARLDLADAADGSPVATATVNLPGEPLNDGECFIKDYGENEGMLEALTEAGVVAPTGQWAESGHVRVPKCRIVGR